MGEREGWPEPCLSCSGLLESFRTRYIIFVSEPQDQVGKDFVHCLDPIISGLVLSCTQGGQSGFMGTRLGNDLFSVLEGVMSCLGPSTDFRGMAGMGLLYSRTLLNFSE